MDKNLKIRSTPSSAKRRSMGSKSMTYDCHDATNYCRIASLRLKDKELEFEHKFFDCYESMLSFTIAGFLFS